MAMIFFKPQRMLRWLKQVFPKHWNDKEERVIRLGEKVIELAQAEGMTREQWHALVDQVYDKPMGDLFQELGGVAVSLSAYLAVTNQDLGFAYEQEFKRIERRDVIELIKSKQKDKLVRSRGIKAD